MSPTKFSSPSIYNPAIQPAEEIISNFVVRLKEFEELFNAIKSDKMKKPPQHFIIQGQRGYGKTTLLLRINFEIKNDHELNSWLIPVMFDEEQYSVHTLAKLWEEVIDILESEESFEGLSDKVDALYDKESPEEEIFNLLIKSLKKQNKKLVLLLDNFGDMIDKFGKKEVQRLREVLITCSNIRVIGASSSILEFYYSYNHPLYDFFKVITLDELTHEETIQLLKKLGETYKNEGIEKIIAEQPERIESLRRLTGGAPRNVVLLFEIFADNIDGNSFKDLEAILDKVTPLYKHRLDNLSTQQQSIIDAIAQNWDAISTKDISKKVRMQSKAVSSQLNQLEKNQLIVKEPTSTKNHLYRINERFFNIYYLMRLGKRKNRNRVLWLVKFFEIWCGEKELTERVQKHIAAVRENKLYEKHVFYMSQALARTSIPPELQHELLSETRKYLSVKKSTFVKELDKSHLEVMDDVVEDIKNERLDAAKKKLKNDGMDDSYISYNIGGILATDQKDFPAAIKYYNDAVEKGIPEAMFSLAFLYEDKFRDFKNAEKYYLMAIEKGDADSMFNLALLYHIEFKDFKKAEKYYLIAIGKSDAGSMYNLAILYQAEYKDLKNAEKFFLMAVEKDHTKAMYSLALLYYDELKDFKNAEKYYLMAIEKGDIEAMSNLAQLYEIEFKDYKSAEKYYLMAVDKDNVRAMNNLAILYQNELKDLKKAEKYFLNAVEMGSSKAMNNIARLYYYELKDLYNSEKYALMAIEKGDEHAMLGLATIYENEYKDFKNAEKYYLMAVEKEYAEAMNNLAVLYMVEFKDLKKAEKYFLMAIENNQPDAIKNLALLYHVELKDFKKAEKYYLMAVEKADIRAMFSLALLYDTMLKDFDKAEKYYLMAIEKDSADAMNNLAWLYYKLKKNKLIALEIQRRAFEKIKEECSATYLMILLWNDKIEEAIKLYFDFFEKEEVQKDVNELVNSIILMFLAKKQFNFVYKLFNENKFDIRDKYKPVYYSTLKLLGDGYSDEFKKMPQELTETVDEILKTVEQMAIDYV